MITFLISLVVLLVGFALYSRLIERVFRVDDRQTPAVAHPDGVDYTLADGTAGSLRGYDNVVLAMGSRSNAVLKETAEKVAPQVFVIGEAAKAPGNAVLATHDALEA